MKIAKKAILLFVSLFAISACTDQYAVKEIKKTSKKEKKHCSVTPWERREREWDDDDVTFRD